MKSETEIRPLLTRCRVHYSLCVRDEQWLPIEGLDPMLRRFECPWGHDFFRRCYRRSLRRAQPTSGAQPASTPAESQP